MTSRTRNLIETLRQSAVALGISMSMSKERDRCARLLFGRPYSAVIPAERDGVLPTPSVDKSRANAIIERNGDAGAAFVLAAKRLVEQHASDVSDGESMLRQKRRNGRSDASSSNQPTAYVAPYIAVLVTLNYAICRNNGLAADDVAEHIRGDGLDAGYDIELVFTDRGGDFSNPVVSILAKEHPEGTQGPMLRQIETLARAAFERLRRAAPKGQAPIYRGIDDAFDADGVETWRKTSEMAYTFRLRGISTDVKVRLTPNSIIGGYDFWLSHHIRIPNAISVYTPSRMWGDTPEYAMRQAVTALTHLFVSAVRQGSTPNASWLVPVRG
jgi:hypothetical protein